MSFDKMSRILLTALLSLSSASLTVQAAEGGRITSLQGSNSPLQRELPLGMDMPTFVNGGATDSAALDNVNKFERLHISQNQLTILQSNRDADRDILIELYNATNGNG